MTTNNETPANGQDAMQEFEKLLNARNRADRNYYEAVCDRESTNGPALWESYIAANLALFAHVRKMAEDAAQADALATALEEMLSIIPARDSNGGLYTVNFDGDGNEIGTESIDPIGVVCQLSNHLDAALTAYRKGRPTP